MLWRVANAIKEGLPINFDRVLGASYNSRSALEALLAHTPEFYWCKPGRIQLVDSSSSIREGHKHLVYLPSDPHENGVIGFREVDQVISEIPGSSAIYEAVSFSESPSAPIPMDIETKRRHLQIQIALVKIGDQLGFRTWIARNDQGFKYGEITVGSLPGVVNSLEGERIISSYDRAIAAALHIDCIWFRNGRFMPAVMEVEHSTGITSGLTRMLGLNQQIPPMANTRWVIVAPDEDRDKVMREATKPQFRELNTQYFPYSAVDELYALCQRRKLNNRAVNEEFLDCYMESCLEV